MSEHRDASINHIVILAHPDPKSFNAAIANTYCDAVHQYGQRTVLRDLYRMNFNPVLAITEMPGKPGFHAAPDVQAEIETLQGSDAFVFISPIWFGMPPAMMKGYVDRVIGTGVNAQQIEGRNAQGVLSHGHLLNITTSGTDEAWFDRQGHIESLRELSDRYLFRAFAMKSAEMMHFGGIMQGLPEATIGSHLEQVRKHARHMCAKLAAERFGAALPPETADGS